MKENILLIMKNYPKKKRMKWKNIKIQKLNQKILKKQMMNQFRYKNSLKKLTSTHKKILLEISNYCETCPIHESCIENECPLFRIEQLILKIMK